MTLYAFKQALQGLEFAAKTCVDKNIDVNTLPPKNHVIDFDDIPEAGVYFIEIDGNYSQIVFL